MADADAAKIVLSRPLEVPPDVHESISAQVHAYLAAEATRVREVTSPLPAWLAETLPEPIPGPGDREAVERYLQEHGGAALIRAGCTTGHELFLERARATDRTSRRDLPSLRDWRGIILGLPRVWRPGQYNWALSWQTVSGGGFGGTNTGRLPALPNGQDQMADTASGEVAVNMVMSHDLHDQFPWGSASVVAQDIEYVGVYVQVGPPPQSWWATIATLGDISVGIDDATTVPAMPNSQSIRFVADTQIAHFTDASGSATAPTGSEYEPAVDVTLTSDNVIESFGPFTLQPAIATHYPKGTWVFVVAGIVTKIIGSCSMTGMTVFMGNPWVVESISAWYS
jgi:hypothetical protein